MGCDIHSFAEVKRNNKWKKVTEKIFDDGIGYPKTSEPFGWRSYGMFGFLANVRNYSNVPFLQENRGMPNDSEFLSDYENRESFLWDTHSHGWLFLSELVNFDYDKEFEDLRYTKTEGNHSNGAAVAEPGNGNITTFRDFLGSGFFDHIETLKTLGDPGDVRIVFAFDN